MDFEIIQHSYRDVLDRIEHSAILSGRDPAAVKLVVVTKTHPVDVVKTLVDLGAEHLGENYAEEALPKIEAAGFQAKIKWHMVGHVQSRKAKLVCEHFDYVHSIDRLKIASALDRRAGEKGKKIPVLVECNVSAEENKFGFPAWDEDDWFELLPALRDIMNLDNLEVKGLMTLAPYLPEPEQSRPYFRMLKKLSYFLQEQFPDKNMGELSMGMSHDFEIAVQEGATWVRIGTAILGERSKRI
jgi:PLP dependent protein